MAVLDAAQRHGCINLQVDLYHPRQGGQNPQEGAAGSVHQLSTDAAQAQGDALLMGFIPEVVAQWLGSTQLMEHLEAGTVMTVQVRVALWPFEWLVKVHMIGRGVPWPVRIVQLTSRPDHWQQDTKERKL